MHYYYYGVENQIAEKGMPGERGEDGGCRWRKPFLRCTKFVKNEKYFAGSENVRIFAVRNMGRNSSEYLRK